MSSFSRGKGVLSRGTPLNQQKSVDNTSKGLAQTAFTRESNLSQTSAKAESVLKGLGNANSGQINHQQPPPAIPKFSSPMHFKIEPSPKPMPTAPLPPTYKPQPSGAMSATLPPPPRPKMTGLNNTTSLNPAPAPVPPPVTAPEDDPYASYLDEMDPSDLPDAPAVTPIPQPPPTTPPALPPTPKFKPTTPQSQPKIGPPIPQLPSPVAKPPAALKAVPKSALAPLLKAPAPPVSKPVAPVVKPAAPVVKPPPAAVTAQIVPKAPVVPVVPPAPVPPPSHMPQLPPAQAPQPPPTPVHSAPAMSATTEAVDTSARPAMTSSDAAPAIANDVSAQTSANPMPAPVSSPQVPRMVQTVEALRHQVAENEKEFEKMRALLAFKDLELAKIEFNRHQNIVKPGNAEDSLSNEAFSSEESPCELSEPRVHGATMVPGVPPFVLPLNTQQSSRAVSRTKRKPAAPAMVEAAPGPAMKKSKATQREHKPVTDVSMLEAMARENEHLRTSLQGYRLRLKTLKRAFNGEYDGQQELPRESDLRDEFRRMLQEEMGSVRAMISHSVYSPPQSSRPQGGAGPSVEELLKLQAQCEQLSRKCERLADERAELEKEKSSEAQQLRDRVKELEPLVSKADTIMKQIMAERNAVVSREAASAKARAEIEQKLEAVNLEKVRLMERIRELEIEHEKKIVGLQEELSRARADHQATREALLEAQSTKKVLQESHEELANALAEVRNSKAADLQRIARFEKENEELRTRVIVLEQRGEEARHSHRDLLGRAALAERLHVEAQERAKELVVARDSAVTALEKRNSEFAKLQNENESLTAQLREGIIRELNRQEAAIATAAAVSSDNPAPSVSATEGATGLTTSNAPAPAEQLQGNN